MMQNTAFPVAPAWTVDSMIQHAIDKYVSTLPDMAIESDLPAAQVINSPQIKEQRQNEARQQAMQILSTLGPEFLQSIVSQYNPNVGLFSHVAADSGSNQFGKPEAFDENSAWIPASYSKIKSYSPGEFRYDPAKGLGTHSNNVERKSFLESTLPLLAVGLGGPMLGAFGNSLFGPGVVGAAPTAGIGMGAADLAGLGTVAGTSTAGGIGGVTGTAATGSLSQADMLAAQQAGLDTAGWAGSIEPGAIGMSGLEPGVAEALASASGGTLTPAQITAAVKANPSLLGKIGSAVGSLAGGGGGLLGSIAPLLGAVAGAAGPSKQDVKTEGSSVSEPWGPQQEYLKKGFQRADELYNTGGPQYYPGQQVAGFSPESEQAFQAIRNRATQGSPLIKTAQNELQKTIGGEYLNSNPWLDKNYDFAADALTRNFREAVAPSIDAQFAASGRYGSGMLRNAQDSAQDTLGRNLGGLAANMYGTNYANERNNQLKGMMFAPTMANQDYFDFEQLQGVGNLREQQNQNIINADMNKWNFNQNRPFQNLERYQKSISGNFGGTSTTSQNQPVTRDRLSGALGGLLAGSELVKNWGSIFGNK